MHFYVNDSSGDCRVFIYDAPYFHRWQNIYKTWFSIKKQKVVRIIIYCHRELIWCRVSKIGLLFESFLEKSRNRSHFFFGDKLFQTLNISPHDIRMSLLKEVLKPLAPLFR